MNRTPDDTSVFDTLGCPVILLDRQLMIRYVNRSGLTRLGYERLEQLSGKPLHDLLPADPASAEMLVALSSPADPGNVNSIESDLLHCDGSRLPFCWMLSDPGDAAGQARSIALVGFDARLIRESRLAATMFQTITDNYTGSIVITDPAQVILYANPAILRMSGYAPDELIGRTPALFKSGQTSADVYRDLWDTLELGGTWRGEFINCRKDGSQFIESKTISAIRDDQGQVQFYFSIGEDLSQRMHYQQRITSLLSYDQLTGLPNRTAFMGALVCALDDAQKRGAEVTVLHVDIDDFLEINEALGADVADQVIVTIAMRIKDTLRQADQLARLGSDKFGILLGPHPPGIDTDICDVAERLLAVIRLPVTPSGRHLVASASIGSASFPSDSDTAGDLLSHAMSATGRAKTEGGNRYYRFDSTAASVITGRRKLLNELRQAIDHGEMVLYYQPQASLFSGAIIGLEALIRWQHPERGLILPGQFIPQAEQSALIIEIGQWVLHEACRQMRAWLDAGLPPVKVAINLAARHFVTPGLQASIVEALALHDLEAHYLEIEITEGAMMHDVVVAIQNMNQLKEAGVRISLDDFGTGYSSLAYLSRFPIDVVKIDQSFVRDITTNPANAAIAQATIAMSHKLGKVVLAEGVETEEQMHYLRRNECDEMQGYFFSGALPAEAIADMLRAGTVVNLFGQQEGSETKSRVLFVDDEINILSSIRRTLRREGYEILTANSAEEAFSLLAKNSVQVIVSDQRMPEMNGTEFLSRVKNLHPETVRMVLSGYSEISAVTDAINKGAVYRFMLKPWDDEKLKEEISGALRHWRELYAPRNQAGD